jgi:hypothetical protein
MSAPRAENRNAPLRLEMAALDVVDIQARR